MRLASFGFRGAMTAKHGSYSMPRRISPTSPGSSIPPASSRASVWGTGGVRTTPSARSFSPSAVSARYPSPSVLSASIRQEVRTAEHPTGPLVAAEHAPDQVARIGDGLLEDRLLGEVHDGQLAGGRLEQVLELEGLVGGDIATCHRHGHRPRRRKAAFATSTRRYGRTRSPIECRMPRPSGPP